MRTHQFRTPQFLTSQFLAHRLRLPTCRLIMSTALVLTATALAPAAHASMAELFLAPFPRVGAASTPTLTRSADATATAPSSPAVLGRWTTASGNLEVDIAPCGQALCGTVTRVRGHRSMQREGDMQAADARPVLGMRILSGLQVAEGDDPTAPDARWFGDIFNRENGRTYRCRIHLDAADPHALVVRPHVFTPLFGQTQRWPRTRADLVPHTLPTETP